MIFITISNIDKKLINTSKILGANKKDTFIFVIFPMIKNGIISALFLGFIRSISEFGATMIVAGNISGKTQTLSTAIYTSIQTGNQMSIFILSMLSILIAVISIFIFNYINKKDGLVL
jgi:molybdate transport system permease protein|tara:strand:- start:6581 stop:6934 length:354 start_codon:yes stop_codon:yes gene_type:complete